MQARQQCRSSMEESLRLMGSSVSSSVRFVDRSVLENSNAGNSGESTKFTIGVANFDAKIFSWQLWKVKGVPNLPWDHGRLPPAAIFDLSPVWTWHVADPFGYGPGSCYFPYTVQASCAGTHRSASVKQEIVPSTFQPSGGSSPIFHDAGEDSTLPIATSWWRTVLCVGLPF